ncbi:Gfo/Idh/MocA family oxidoreductase [Nocardia arizonensis]|uniref:Gfo/Idh/MocA family oxidoreductase n=1 Tax=Nocardia arizonensis TaxID=1141647 RepID=UPI000AC8CC7C|nr:Gfo/Idh/MocA family oxidoreductase [Nocardia arizonensis]
MSAAPERTAVVVGATFGAVYAGALTAPESAVRLVGIVGTGGHRSRALAESLGLPLYTDIDRVPPVDLAVVVVRAGIVGGPGSRISARLLERGIHVLQEQPVHAEEMIDLARTAARHGVRYGVNDFYSGVEPVRQFIGAAANLARISPIRYVHARAALQVAFPLFGMLARILPRLTPARVDVLPAPAAPFASVRLTLDDVAVDLLIDNQLCADDPDNYLRLLHEFTVGTEAGELSLAHTHGSTYWRRRRSGAPTDAPIAQRIGETFDPTVAETCRTLWPPAVRHAVDTFATALGTSRNTLSQRQIRAARLWASVTSAMGPAVLIAPPEIPAVTAEDLIGP